MQHKKISEHRFREEFGLYYEDCVVGDTYEHWPGRTIIEADNVWQSLLCLNNHPLHINQDYAKKTEFGQIVVSSLVTFCVVNGMTVNTLSARAIANLGWDKVRLLQPVFVNDTLYAESTILDKRLSRSRKGQGIVTAKTIGLNQNKEVVISFERTFLLPLKSESDDGA